MGEASGKLDRDTLEQVLSLVSRRCRQEIEEALVSPRELSISCKQDVQNVFFGYDESSQGDPVPEILEESALLRYHTAISLSACLFALLVILFRGYRTREYWATARDRDDDESSITTTGNSSQEASSSKKKGTKKKSNKKVK